MATKYPPYLNLNDAIKVIRKIYETHKGREVSSDLMPDILGVTAKSSYFPKQIAALNKYEFIDKKPNDQLYLTNLSMQIIQPINQAEAEQAKLKAARNIDVLNDIINRYPNFVLPSLEQLKEYLHKSHSIDRETLEEWAKYILESIKVLTPENNVQTSPSINISPQGTPNTSFYSSSKGELEKTVGLSSMQNFELPNGKKFYFHLEEGYTTDDLDFIMDFFELKKKRIKNRPLQPKMGNI